MLRPIDWGRMVTDQTSKAQAEIGGGLGSEATVRIKDPVDRYLATAVRGSIVLMGGAGLLIFFKQSRLFRQFRHINEIPADYYQRGVELKGIVRDVTANGSLKVEHMPRIRLARPFGPYYPKNPPLLNVCLAGIDILPSGRVHLEKAVPNRRVVFTPIGKSSANVDAVEAEVLVKKSTTFIPSSTNLNVDLVRRGFARVCSAEDQSHVRVLQSNRNYARLVTRLLACEKVADRRGVGNWKRAIWVESLEALPATFTQLVKSSAITKLAVLLYTLVWDLTTLVYIALKQGYYLGRTLVGYLCVAYGKFVIGVERISNFYFHAKSRLQGKGKRAIAESGAGKGDSV